MEAWPPRQMPDDSAADGARRQSSVRASRIPGLALIAIVAWVFARQEALRADTDAALEGWALSVPQSPDFEESPSTARFEWATSAVGTRAPSLAGPITPATTQPSGALSGRIVFMSAGHGWTYDAAQNSWYTQRPMLNEMVEDYGNLDQMTMFAAYCFNAGATVVPFRPIGFQTNEVILDNDSPGVVFAGNWSVSSSSVFYGTPGAEPYRFAAVATAESATATYTPDLPAAGFYPAYAWARHGSDRISQLYRISHTGGQARVRVPHHLVGNGWVYLGTYHFARGADSRRGAVVISNLQAGSGSGGVVIADAIRFGNGMGDVRPATGATVSGYPREEEAARYWVQAGLGQGQTNALYDTPGDDGSDNVGTPPRTAREMNREASGSFYDRVFLSFHSNAGGGRGCVGLYNNNTLFPGTATSNQFRWAQLVGLEVNNDLSAIAVPPLEVSWYNRGANVTLARSDFAFGEIRNDALGSEMDATIIEVAFHDNADDARLMRDPKVRNAVARACYQATVRYFNQFTGVPLDFLPEAPTSLRVVAEAEGTARLHWELPESGGGLATGFVVYQSLDGYGFGEPISVPGGTNTSWAINGLAPGTARYFRVAASNAGGESLPSSTVAVCVPADAKRPRVLVVDGFDRFDRMLAVRQAAGPGIGGVGGGSATFDRVKPRLMNGFDDVVPYAAALQHCQVGVDSCSHEALLRAQVSLTNYAAVVWFLGEESTRDETFSAAEQDLVARYADAGGQVLVSGAEVAWDLGRASGPTAADRVFLGRYLHAALASDADDDAGTYAFAVRPGSIFGGRPGGVFDDGTRGSYNVDYPDVLTPAGTGVAVALNYVGGRGGAAALQYDGTGGAGRTVFLGFPFERITDPELRLYLTGDVLRFFGLLPRPRLFPPRPALSAGKLELTWTAVPGQRYQLEVTSGLGPPAWTNAALPQLAVATEITLELAELEGASERFYRVRLVGEETP